MLFDRPLLFAEAAQMRAAKSVLPTSLSSAQLAKLRAEFRERSNFSARMENAAYLQYSADRFDALIQGQLDGATVRANLKDVLDFLDVGAASPDEEDTILDPRSDARLNLRINMEAAATQGYGGWQQGQDPALLDYYPAQELYRAEFRMIPRDWLARWQDAGGELYEGRMIALKNDPIWSAISAFGTPYPPFDYNSGMDVRDVDRLEAMRLGIITRDEQVPPATRDFAADAGTSAKQFSAWVVDALLYRDVRLDGAVLRPAGRSVDNPPENT